MSERKIAIHYGSMVEPWIDFVVIANWCDAEKAEDAVRRAVDIYWDSDDQCYGDVVARELETAGLKAQFALCSYDEETNEPTDEWRLYCDGLCREMPVIEI